METNTNYSMKEYIKASPLNKLIVPVFVSFLVFEHWGNYGVESLNLLRSHLLSWWPIVVVIVLAVLDGVVRYYQKRPMTPLKDDARYKKCSQINLYLFFSWLGLSTVSRIFLSLSIDRIVALYVGPMVALLIFINVLHYFFKKEEASRKFS